jgi:hypothetical protein
LRHGITSALTYAPARDAATEDTNPPSPIFERHMQ